VGRVLPILAIILGYATGQTLVLPHAENHPVRTGAVLALLLIPAGLVWLVSDGAGMFAVSMIFIAGLGWGWIEGWDNQDNYIDPYCRYGAQSKKQLDSCKAHVNSEEIDKLDTPAAKFALGVIDECGRGSGPYCAEASKFDRGG
jgi:hypothetical protein